MKRANTTFLFGHRQVAAGDIVADDDPILKGRDQLFDEITPTYPVEDATARPGSKRSMPKKASSKKVSSKKASEEPDED